MSEKRRDWYPGGELTKVGKSPLRKQNKNHRGFI
jgi:hypothetical protein